MTIMKKAGIIVLITAALAACKGSETVTKNTADNSKKKVACADLHFDMGKPHIDWFEEKKSVFNNSEKILVLPKEYKVYSVDSAQVAEFFKYCSMPGTKLESVVPLPKPADCRLFTFQNNSNDGANIPAGNAYTVGECLEQKMMLNYVNGQMKGLVEWYGIMFELLPIVVPIVTHNKTYYILYQKQMPKEDDVEKIEKQTRQLNEMVEYKPVK